MNSYSIIRWPEGFFDRKCRAEFILFGMAAILVVGLVRMAVS